MSEVKQYDPKDCVIRALDATRIDGTDVTSNEKLGQYIFDNVIVRLVLDAGMDYQTVFCYITPTEIAEANAA